MNQESQLIEIPACEGRAAQLTAGSSVLIVNTFGHQVVDLWAFHARDLSRFLSMEHTRATLSRTTPGVGDALVDNRREPMLTFESDDSPGVHDTLIAACDRFRYEKLGCKEYHRNCADNMAAALAGIGLSVPACPPSLNLWMNIPILADGTLNWCEPVSRPGDKVIFRAFVDCVVVMSACPQDIVPINAGRPVAVRYAVVPG